MSEKLIRRGTQHEMRATQLLRRRLEKNGFKLQKPRSLTEPLVELEMNEENMKTIVEFIKRSSISCSNPEDIESEDIISKLDTILGEERPLEEEKNKPKLPSTVDIMINVVEEGGKTYYEVDIYQIRGPAVLVSEDQLVTQQQLPESCDSATAVPKDASAEAEMKARKKELEKLKARIDKVDGDVKSSLEELGTKRDKAEAERKGRIDEVKNLLNSRISQNEKMINGLGKEVRGKIADAKEEMEAETDELKGKMGEIDARMGEVEKMKAKTDELEAAMAKMEDKVKEHGEFIENMQSD